MRTWTPQAALALAATAVLSLTSAIPAQAATTLPVHTSAMTATQALAALDTLPADNPASQDWTSATADNSDATFPGAFSKTNGRTGWFGDAWYDVDGNGCDTRNDILTRDMVDTDYSKAAGTQAIDQGVGQGVSSCRNATVYFGTLHDAYTATTIAFTRGQDTSEAVQIDHIIPLGYIYAHGGWSWSADKRLEVANDPMNLQAVDGPTNGSKSDSGPATSPTGSTKKGTYKTTGGKGFVPPNTAYTCTYATRFTEVAATYDLGLPAADITWLRDTLTGCAADEAAAVATATPATTPTTATPASKATTDPRTGGTPTATTAASSTPSATSSVTSSSPSPTSSKPSSTPSATSSAASAAETPRGTLAHTGPSQNVAAVAVALLGLGLVTLGAATAHRQRDAS